MVPTAPSYWRRAGSERALRSMRDTLNLSELRQCHRGMVGELLGRESAMRERLLLVAGAVALALCCGGCAFHKHHGSAALSDPIVVEGADGAVPVPIEGPVVRKATFVDRHPLLSRPRDVYHNTGHGPIIKTTAATFVGVPVGVVHEVKQIVCGIPPASKY